MTGTAEAATQHLKALEALTASARLPAPIYLLRSGRSDPACSWSVCANFLRAAFPGHFRALTEIYAGESGSVNLGKTGTLLSHLATPEIAQAHESSFGA